MAYLGTMATILAGQGGYNGSENYDSVPYTSLIQALNVRYDGDAWRKAGGFTALDSNAIANSSAAAVAGVDFWSDATTQNQIVVWDDGKATREIAGDLDAVYLQNSLTVTSSPPVLLMCGQEVTGNNRKVIMFSQGQQPRVLNAASNSFANLTAASGDWSNANQPMGGILHDRRVFAWGNPNAKHAIYVSALDDHTNFLRYDPNDSNSDFLPSFDINPGEGEEIRALLSIGTSRLYVFKYPVGIYFVDTSQITSYLTPVTTVRNDIGIAGPKAIAKAGDLGTFFIGADAHIYNLELISNPDVDPRQACITAQLNMVKWIQDNVKLTRMKFAQLIWDSNRQELHAYYTKPTGTTINNIGLVVDLRNPQNPRIGIEDRGSFYNACWFRRNNTTYYNELIVGGSGGKVYRTNQPSRAIGAAGYDARFRTSDTDFNWLNQDLAAYIKRFDWLEIVYNSTFAASVFIDTYIDGQYYNTYSARMAQTSAVLGSFILGTDTLAVSGQARAKIKIGGMGKRFGLVLRNSDVNSDFSISRLVVHFTKEDTGGEKD